MTLIAWTPKQTEAPNNLTSPQIDVDLFDQCYIVRLTLSDPFMSNFNFFSSTANNHKSKWTPCVGTEIQ